MMHLKTLLLSAALAYFWSRLAVLLPAPVPLWGWRLLELTLRVGTTASADGFNAMTENGSFGKAELHRALRCPAL